MPRCKAIAGDVDAGVQAAGGIPLTCRGAFQVALAASQNGGTSAKLRTFTVSATENGQPLLLLDHMQDIPSYAVLCLMQPLLRRARDQAHAAE